MTSIIRGSSYAHLLLDYLTVDLSGRDVVVPRQSYVEVTLVVSEVKIHLATIVEDIDLAYDRVLKARRLRNSGRLVPCSLGRMVPASMFMYGSILIAVTFSPVVLSSKPVEDASGVHCASARPCLRTLMVPHR